MERDLQWMQRALDLAGRAAGRTAPNPVVGAVIVRDGAIIGEGWHVRAGEPHAETVALAQAGDAARGAEMYVTLEPCSHEGRTPPCAPAVVAAGLRRVIVAIQDPDSRVGGRGLDLLRKAGVEVTTDVLPDRATRVNEAYLHRVRTGRAFGVMKAAVTLDGRLGADGGDSRWITGEAARERAHEYRDLYDAVLVGRGTLETDDPSLDVRLAGQEYRDPWVVVVDTHLAGATMERKLWDRATKGARVIVATCADSSPERRESLTARGVELMTLPVGQDGRLDLSELFRELAVLGANSVLVEGGGQLHTSCLAAGLIGRAHLFVAPVLLGGAEPGHVVRDLGFRSVAEAIRLEDVEHETLGDDVLISGRVKES